MLSLITHSHTLSLFSHTNSSHLRYPCMFSLTSRHSHSPHPRSHSHQVFSHVIPHHSLTPTHLTYVIPACSHSPLVTHSHGVVPPTDHVIPHHSLTPSVLSHSSHPRYVIPEHSLTYQCYPCMSSLTSRHSHSPIVIPHHSLPLTPLSPISPIPHIPQLIDHHRSSPPITTYSLPNASTHDPNTIQRPNSTPNPPNSSPQSPKHTHHTHNDNSRTPLIYHTTQPIQSRRWDKPQGLAGQSQLIPSQYPLHTKSSTKDCIDNTISFNTIQIVFLYPKRIKYSYVKYILSL